MLCDDDPLGHVVRCGGGGQPGLALDCLEVLHVRMNLQRDPLFLLAHFALVARPCCGGAVWLHRTWSGCRVLRD
jgi:hypothetical protein